MRLFVTDEARKLFGQGMKHNRLEANIRVVRRKAIWANRNPDIAERLYRAKVLENQEAKAELRFQQKHHERS